ncbi:DUF2164 domain-containing protein [Bacillus sp. SM2101]|uniref:DUF2164 domain-containing protein n=1 Tax=Bacillus sp. SM2101 TaxID=2805366 RepID=UPI001BDDFF05|nr:DUF2164 domain-containing protein [Bacillus sp. SM2101]
MKLSKESQDDIITNIQRYFYDEHSEEIGELAARNLLDFAMKELGPHFYNAGVKDSIRIMTQGISNIEDDMYSLLRKEMNG